MSTTYENTRRHARALETALEAKLSTYSKIAAGIAASSSSSSSSSNTGGGRASGSGNMDRYSLEEEGVGGYKLVEEEIEELLEKLSQTTTSLSSLLDAPSQMPSSSMMHAVQRHKDVLEDYKRDYARTKQNVGQALARQNLLGSVRKDINAYKSSLPPQTDALLAERGRIDSSNRMTDEILSQAYATREDFAGQRTVIANINSRMGGVLSTLPGINSILSMIKSRRRRDTIIVGGVIAICVVLLLAYMTGW